MSKYLITTSETYRVDSEEEVNILIEESKNNSEYELSKYNCQKKEKKVKGQIEDEWFRVTLVKVFTEEKEPGVQADVHYEIAEFEANFE